MVFFMGYLNLSISLFLLQKHKLIYQLCHSSPANLWKNVCEKENKTINTKLKEIVREEIKKKFGDILEHKKEEKNE